MKHKIDIGSQVIRQIVAHTKYNAYLKDLQRRETIEENIAKNKKMHLDRFPHMDKELDFAYGLVEEGRVLPSMRSLQFGGSPILKHNAKAYNCSYAPIDSIYSISEAMYLLLCGTGFGYSVKSRHINQLPAIKHPDSDAHYVIDDSIEGWADAVRALLESRFGYSRFAPNFIFDNIRPAGSRLSSGVIAPGPEKLEKALNLIESLLDSKKDGDKLTSLEVSDIVCYVADCVVSGGVRRCIAEGSLVTTKEGSFKRIEDINVGDEVSTPDGWKRVMNTFVQGEQDTLIIKHKNGELNCTPNHRVARLTSANDYEWVNASDINPGDRLFYVYNESNINTTYQQMPAEESYPIHQSTTVLNSFTMPEHCDEEVAWFLGALHGDGYVFLNETHGSVTIASNQTDIAYTNQIVNGFKKFGIEAKVRTVDGEQTVKVGASGRRFATYMYNNFKKPNTPLSVPGCIKNSSVSVKMAYVQGLMDADGCVKNRPISVVNSVYKDYIKEIQNLLYGCGIVSRLADRQYAARQAAGWKPIYQLNLINKSSRDRFAALQPSFAVKKVPVRSTSHCTDAYPIEFVSNRKFKELSVAGITKGNARVPFDAYNRLDGAEGALLPMEVLSITQGNNVATYDIEVEDAHCFLCEGVMVHNSALICLFDWNDVEMLQCKVGDWWNTNPQRGRANNSASLNLTWPVEILKERFDFVVRYTREALLSGSGDPGVSFTADDDYGWNPCKPLSSVILTADGYITYAQALELESLRVVNESGTISEATKPFKTKENADIYRVEFNDGVIIEGTGNHLHKVILDGCEVWMELENMLPGTIVKKRNFNGTDYNGYTLVEVVSNYVDRQEDVYDITVHDDSHAYFDNGVVTHNCHEALLYYNFCNLCEIVGNQVETQKDFDEAAHAAAIIGTFQASLTDFKYLRPIWKERTEKEALLGVGITAMVEGKTLDLDMWQAGTVVNKTNANMAQVLGINRAHRTTVIKPSGTSTLYAGAHGSGIHDAPSETSYLRRIRVGKTEALYGWLKANMPMLIEDEAFDPTNTAVLTIPRYVDSSTIKHWAATPFEFADRVKHVYDNWIMAGHNQGPNGGTHNVSATVYLEPKDHDAFFEWMWENRDHYRGMALLPKTDANYPQLPIEPCDDETYSNLVQYLVEFDPKQVFEPEDMTSFGNEAACAGGQCTID